ncbi:MgtC/SapB family protein [Candidatus Gracilibacteria bacterium]|nr:MgtC/SapB family protein [Candidatus Gracilibacteria bacterium]
MEREQKHQVLNRQSFAGVRTMMLSSLLGVLAWILAGDMVAVFSVITAGYLILVIASYVMTAKKVGGLGATSEIAAMLMYAIGVMAGMERFLLATVVTMVLILILHFKQLLHGVAKNISDVEVLSAIKFMIIAGVILPLLPNVDYGPYGFFNPYIVWLMVVFISGISFISYVAVKVLGMKKGIGLTGFLAGFVSTTALALSFSAESKKHKRIVNPYVVGMTIASSALFFRVMLEVLVLNPSLLKDLWLPMTVMGSVGFVIAYFLWNKKEETVIKKDFLKLKSPFRLAPALMFGFFFAVIIFASKYLQDSFGNSGIYMTSLVSGFFDVDAVTVSLANLAKNGLAPESAVMGITMAAMVNTFSKFMMFVVLGSRKVAMRMALVYSAMIGSGVLVMMFV